ncbi:VWA domain-containing protein [Kutzneria sp. NPDC052558]|uniref:vWA domain-containing protein n=1 Tax=Kutzneria sp. NPDC052558 TaxID=3364121 RepID=UPI0037C9D18D
MNGLGMMRGLSVAGVAVLLLASSAITSWADPSRADILNSIGADAVAADYVVLVDTSGSMAADGRYSSVVHSLTGLFDAMSPGDHVSVYTFDDAVTPVYLGPAEPAATILGKLPAGPNPTGATDLGKAIGTALDTLEQPSAAPVANVVLVTDGAHEPPPGSPYPQSTGPAWDALRQRASRFTASTVSAYAVPLGDHASGAALLKSVFPDAVVLDPENVQDLHDYLARTKATVELAKARTLLAEDTGKSLNASWKFAGAKVSVTLKSKTRHVPIAVSGLALTAGDGDVVAKLDTSTVQVAPGQEVTLKGSVAYQPSSGLTYQHTESTTTAITVHGDLSSPWTAGLQPDIRLGLPEKFEAASPPQTFSTAVGSPWFIPVAVLALAAMAAGITAVLRRRGQVLSGVLVVRGGDGDTVLAKFPLSGTTTTLDNPALPGRGEVAAVRRRGRTNMRISYSSAPGARPAVSGLCGPGGSLVLGGLFFAHVKIGG